MASFTTDAAVVVTYVDTVHSTATVLRCSEGDRRTKNCLRQRGLECLNGRCL